MELSEFSLDEPQNGGPAGGPGGDLSGLQDLDFSNPAGKVDREAEEMIERGQVDDVMDLREYQQIAYHAYGGICSAAEAYDASFAHTHGEKEPVAKIAGRILQRRMGHMGENADILLLMGVLAGTWGPKAAKANLKKESQTPKGTSTDETDEDAPTRPRDTRRSMNDVLSEINGQ